jgi:xanthine dehydrogenase YagT iron-sulfur-binding subunit
MPVQNQTNSRRDFLKKSTGIAALTIASPVLVKAAENDEKIATLFEQMPLRLEVNGVSHTLPVEPRVPTGADMQQRNERWRICANIIRSK